MSNMNCRAPYQPDERYQQLRLPNTQPSPATAVLAAALANQPSNSFNDGTQSLANAFGATGVAYQQQQQQQVQQQQQQQALAVPNMSVSALMQTQMQMRSAAGVSTNLSASATEFVPQINVQNYPHFNSYQQQPHQQQRQQLQQQQQRPGHDYYNGYNQPQKDHHQQQQKQQASQYQQYNNNASGVAIQHVATTLQDRLRISGNGGHAGGSGGSKQSGNYFQQHQHQQQQSHQPHHTKHFQKHPHLNHYQQHHQQQQQHHHQQSSSQSHHRHQQQHHHHQQQQQQQQHHHNSHSRQDTYYSNNATAANTSNTNITNSSNADNNSTTSHPDMETIALEYLDTVIHCLNQNPGQFNTIAPRFLTIFDGMENNNFVLSIAMEDIFEKSIENPNFRYMGAKLYNLLHMMNPKKDSLFHTLLKCKLDFHQLEVRKFIESNQQNKVRETALFLAELYMQLRGDDSRIHLIAVNIVYSLKQLLAKENNENVRCICLTLKLAGYDLTADCPEEMNEIIVSLDNINQKSPGLYPLAANVIQLQKNNWGRKVSNSLGEGESAKPPEPPRLSDEPVFYGPDGRELTAEEVDFLAGDTVGNDDDEDDDDDDDENGGDLDPEMDEETERAYKDFCKQNKAAAANS